MSSKIKKINLIKIVLDIIMSVLLVLMFNKRIISMDFHEIGGLFVCILFLVHKLINWKWIVAVSKKIFSKDVAFKIRFGYIINFLLLMTMSLILLSGIFISKTLFTGISVHGGNWKALHYAASALSLILVGIHIGLHWGFVMGMFKKYIKIPIAIAKPINIILVIAVVAFGSYSMFTSNFRMWLTAPFTTTQLEGGQRPVNFDFQTDGSNSGTDSVAPDQSGNSTNSAAPNNSSQNLDKNSQATDNIQQDQPNQGQNGTQKRNGTRPTKPNGGKGFSKGNRPSGDSFPQNGDGIPSDRLGVPGDDGRTNGIGGAGNSDIPNVILTFTSIIGLFAAITYYCEKLLKRRKKSSQAIIQN